MAQREESEVLVFCRGCLKLLKKMQAGARRPGVSYTVGQCCAHKYGLEQSACQPMVRG